MTTQSFCKARKGDVIVYEDVSTYAFVSGGTVRSVKYRPGIVTATSRDGRVRAFSTPYGSPVFDDRRRYSDRCSRWWVVPNFDAASIPSDWREIGFGWPSIEDARAAFREVVHA